MSIAATKKVESGAAALIVGDPESERVIWESLVPRLLSPIRIAILEALRWIGRPLTANDLATMLDHQDYYLGVISYHLKVMAKFSVVVLIESRQVRGAREYYYFFPTST